MSGSDEYDPTASGAAAPRDPPRDPPQDLRRPSTFNIAVEMQLNNAARLFEAAGIPMTGGNFSWDRFSSSVDAPIPYPSTTAALLELGENIMRQAQMVVDGWKLANSTSRIGGADRPASGARATSPAPSASGSLVVVRRASSPTDSTASRSTAGGSGKRKLDETSFAANAAASSGTPNLLNDNYPLEVQLFFPVLGGIVREEDSLADLLHELASSQLALPGDFSEISTSELDNASVHVDPNDQFGDMAAVAAHLGRVHELLPRLHEQHLRLRALVRRAFDLYSLGARTPGASWLTVRQLLFREQWDADQLRFNRRHVAITAWADKVQAAIVGCKQEHALSKDGSLRGPVDPYVLRHLGGRGERDGGAGAGTGGRGR